MAQGRSGLVAVMGLGVAALGALVWAWWPDAPPSEGPRRVFLVGWDGADPRLTLELLEEGRLPNLQKLKDEGSYGLLHTIQPTHSPAIWTTIATGKLPDDHGILTFGYPSPEGDGHRLYNATHRTAAPLWTVATDAGLEVDVVGWWATWPVDALRGTMVSDRFAVNRMELVEASGGQQVAAEERGIRVPGTFSPPEAEPRLEACREDPSLLEDPWLSALAEDAVGSEHEEALLAGYDAGRGFYAQDQTYACIVRDLLAERVPDLLLTYTEAPDVAGHFYWKYRYPEEHATLSGEPVPMAEVERYRGAVAAAYEAADRQLGEVLAHRDEHTTVVLVSDHGMTVGHDPERPYFTGTHATAPPGILVVSGAGARKGVRVQGAHVTDVAPTVLALLGLPVAEDMAGRVLVEALTEAPGVASVASYPAHPLTLPEGQDAESDLIDRLEAIGYAVRDEAP